MDDSDDISKLEELLAAEDSDEETNPPAQSVQRSIGAEQTSNSSSLFLEDVVKEEKNILSLPKNKGKSKKSAQEIEDDKLLEKVLNHSVVHDGDTDSSDDEDKRNFERKYDDCGTVIKKIIESKNTNHDRSFTKDTNTFKSTAHKSSNLLDKKTPVAKTNNDVYADPIFGIRMTNPLISGAALTERMQGREPISMFNVKRHVSNSDLTKDWVIAGAIVRKSASKESQKGSQYCIWTLSDLKGDLKTVALFLFKTAYKQHWKMSEGTVVGILNPNVLDRRDDSQDQACLSVDNPDRVMIMGKSKDFGYCKSKKKNGEPCTSFVNIYQCQYCIFHVKQEYQKCSKRSDIQASFTGKGLIDLRNKVLGKNTVFYAGKEFSAIPATKSKKLTAQDNKRLRSLSEYFKGSEQDKLLVNKNPIGGMPIKKRASHVELNVSQRLKDLKRLEMLRGSASDIKENESKSLPSSPVAQSKLISKSPSSNIGPNTLGLSLRKDSTVDLCMSFSIKQKERAKFNAKKWIQNNGPINKINPNGSRGTIEGKKRLLEQFEDKVEEDSATKKQKTGVLSDRFQKMLEAKSAHIDLLQQHDDSEQEKYFKKLELKESMEEKMLNTYKVPCKGVKCLKCSYTNFSASEKCKTERHPLKVFDTFKRFFKCGKCGNRTASLDLIPMHSCKNCQSSKWERAPMINERKGTTLADTLSIRGEEEKFIGGAVQSGANINLLVPDS